MYFLVVEATIMFTSLYGVPQICLGNNIYKMLEMFFTIKLGSIIIRELVNQRAIKIKGIKKNLLIFSSSKFLLNINIYNFHY